MLKRDEGAATPPPGVTPNFEHPEDVLKTLNAVVGLLVIGVMAFFVLLRLSIRAYMMRMIQREDWICLFAWIFSTGYCITGVFMGAHGGGNHQWEVTKHDMVRFNQALYANTLTYGPSAFLVKVTLLSMVANLFSPFRKVVITVYTFIVFMFLYYLPVLIIKIAVCVPIAGFWDPSIKTKCVNQTLMLKTDTVMSALMDIVILVLPIPVTYSLTIPFAKKARIMAILGLGGIATLASIVRLIIVFQPDSFQDETLKFVRFNLLAVAEVGIGLVCACIPTITSIFALWNRKKNVTNSQYGADVKSSRRKKRNPETLSTTCVESTRAEDFLSDDGEFPKGPIVTYTLEISAGPGHTWDGPWDGKNHVTNHGIRTQIGSLGPHPNVTNRGTGSAV